ncbi:hypothetical protein [Agromyces sp. GXS1127]|uniref:hypothetical protein n=1 Tax=Agromyces sp. GXS1127 TaxID=3424181 RepID=UPI003D321375
MSGSYGEPGRPMPDPKQPVTSMDTEAARDHGRAHEDPSAHGGPELGDLPSTTTGAPDDEAAAERAAEDDRDG